MAMNPELKKEYELLDEAHRLWSIYEREGSPKKRKGLIRKPSWKKKSSVKRCEDCTKKKVKILVLGKLRSRCLLCGKVLCQKCVKHIPHYVFTSTEDNTTFDIDACGTCVPEVEEQYRLKQQEAKKLQETTEKVTEQVELWNGTWDRYLEMKESLSQYELSAINEMNKEIETRKIEITYYKNELITDWRDDNKIITRDTYDGFINECDEIIQRECGLTLESSRKGSRQGSLQGRSREGSQHDRAAGRRGSRRSREGSKKQKGSCLRTCFRLCTCCCGSNEEDDREDDEPGNDNNAY